MINSITNIFRTEDLDGAFLTQPLKAYHSFCAEKIERNSGLSKLAWVTATVVSGIFAYPFLGALAVAGILVKLTGVNSLRKHNQTEKPILQNIVEGIKYYPDYSINTSNMMKEVGLKMETLQEYQVTKQNADQISDALNKDINILSNAYRRIYLAGLGNMKTDGIITIHLNVMDHT